MKRIVILAAAAMAVGGFCVPAHAAAGEQAILSNSQAGASVARLTDEALTPHDMRRLVTNFPASDMRRLIQDPTYNQNFGERLDTRIERICRTWRDKYGHDFERSRLETALNSQFVNFRSAAHPAAYASIHLGATGAEPALHFRLVRDVDSWSIAVPHRLTAQRLRENLLNQFSDFDQNVSRWPAREDDAYRQLSDHVMRAVLDVQAPAAKAAQAPAPALSHNALAQAAPRQPTR